MQRLYSEAHMCPQCWHFGPFGMTSTAACLWRLCSSAAWVMATSQASRPVLQVDFQATLSATRSSREIAGMPHTFRIAQALQELTIQQLQWHPVRGQSDNMTDLTQLSLVEDIFLRGDVGFAPKLWMTWWHQRMPSMFWRQWVWKASSALIWWKYRVQVSQPYKRADCCVRLWSWLTRPMHQATKKGRCLFNWMLNFVRQIIAGSEDTAQIRKLFNFNDFIAENEEWLTRLGRLRWKTWQNLCFLCIND